MPLGQRIRWARKRAGLSHDRLVERVGSNRSHLIKIEKGLHMPRLMLRRRIADACGVPHELFEDDDEEEADAVKTLDEFLRTRIRQILREERESWLRENGA
jgi:transcriptional regulator with XRE-family HTH domain